MGFNKSVQAVKKTVACPICQKQVELHAINSHIDGGECESGGGIQDTSASGGSQDVIDIADDSDKEKTVVDNDSAQTFSIIATRKRKSEEFVTKNSKFKVDKNEEEDKDSFLSDDVDDELLAALCSPKKSNVSSSSITVKLSPSISYNPARYKGIHQLS